MVGTGPVLYHTVGLVLRTNRWVNTKNNVMNRQRTSTVTERVHNYKHTLLTGMKMDSEFFIKGILLLPSMPFRVLSSCFMT